MSIAGSIVIYLCAWWIFFLMLLPWGVNRSLEEGATRFGAPAKAALGWKALVATLAAMVFTLGLYLADRFGLIDLRYLLTGAGR